jgi:hypothetical protein
VHIAAEQAALKTSLSAMMVNLARRSQTLVDGMLRRLDHVERDELDADRLQQMFALDSLAVRMRRNDENLLVLAGADSSPPRHEDVKPIDVLKAAQSEIEQFHRVMFGAVDDDVLVAATAVNDVVRIVAELLDNATRFSRPDTPVLCEARRLRHQLVIQIEDRGVGMAPDGARSVNAMLASPRQLDVATVRQMGIAVVARLAARHHIHVHIQAQPHYGLVATIALPAAVLILPPGRHNAPVYPTAAPPPVGTSAEGSRRGGEVARHHAGRRPHRADETMPLPVVNGQTWAPANPPWPEPTATATPGLPKRAPQAQLPGPQSTRPVAVPAPRPPLEQTRERITAYQAGVRRARDHRPPSTA